jgi:hypothetical protein
VTAGQVVAGFDMGIAIAGQVELNRLIIGAHYRSLRLRK